MSLNVRKLVSELEAMTVKQLRRKYAQVYGEETRSHHKAFLVRRIAWRMQALEEGDLPERARQRAMEIANDADLRSRAPGPGADPRPSPQAVTKTVAIDVPPDERLPMPGALLTRRYKGKMIQVRVLPKGFDHDGTIYRSLSAVARAVTGSHWNGYHFFGLTPPKRESKKGDNR